MPIASTGPVTFTSLRTEFIGGSAAINFSDLYSGGGNSYIRTPAANNTATSLSPNVPTSGAIAVSNFRGASKGFRFTFTSNATNQDASAIFGDDYGVDYPKEIVIDSGVELGGTSASEEALQINSGGLGTIKIINNGTLTGAGGAANGGAGGDAFEANVACIFINNGSIRSGGGGGARGGNGGNGGGGRYTTTASNATYITFANSGSPCSVSMFGGIGSNYVNKYVTQSNCCMGEGYRCQLYGRLQSTVNTSGGGGGAGGNGGRGAGYNQTVANGSGGAGGANGGTNAGAGGTGGTGGNGGGFGADGSGGTNGSGGNNGNRTNGSGGGSATSAGAAGKSIRGISSVTLTNNGTIIGGQV